MKRITAIVTALAFLLKKTSPQDLNFTGFVNVENPPQNFTSISISPISTKRFWGTVHELSWTIEPHDEDQTIISVTPPGFVIPSVDNDEEQTLVFSFQENDAQPIFYRGGMGVRIRVPSGMIESVTVGELQIAQILNGFTSLTRLTVSSISKLHANLTSVGTEDGITAKVGNYSKLVLQTDAPTQVDIDRKSETRIKGSVSGGIVDDESHLYVDGDITGQVNVSGVSGVFIKSDSGCDNVLLENDTMDECNVTAVDVKVELLPTTYQMEINIPPSTAWPTSKVTYRSPDPTMPPAVDKGGRSGSSSFRMSKKTIITIITGAYSMALLLA